MKFRLTSFQISSRLCFIIFSLSLSLSLFLFFNKLSAQSIATAARYIYRRNLNFFKGELFENVMLSSVLETFSVSSFLPFFLFSFLFNFGFNKKIKRRVSLCVALFLIAFHFNWTRKLENPGIKANVLARDKLVFV